MTWFRPTFTHDIVQAYAAGFLEGHVTSELLHMHWLNTVDGYCKGKGSILQNTISAENFLDNFSSSKF
jgi:hypothetical protein